MEVLRKEAKELNRKLEIYSESEINTKDACGVAEKDRDEFEEQLTQVQKSCADTKSKINELKAQVDILGREKRKLEEDLPSWRSKNVNLILANSVLKKKADTMLKQRTERLREEQQLKHKLERSGELLKTELVESRKKMESKARSFQEEIDEKLKEYKKSCNDLYERQKRDFMEVLQKNDEIKCQKVRESIDEMSVKCTSLQGEETELQNNISFLKRDISSESAQAKEKLTKLRQQLNDKYKEKENMYKKELALCLDKKKSIAEAVSQLEAQLNEQSAATDLKILKVERTLRDQKRESERMKFELTEKNKRIRLFENEHGDYSQELNTLQQLLVGIDDTVIEGGHENSSKKRRLTYSSSES